MFCRRIVSRQIHVLSVFQQKMMDVWKSSIIVPNSRGTIKHNNNVSAIKNICLSMRKFLSYLVAKKFLKDLKNLKMNLIIFIIWNLLSYKPSLKILICTCFKKFLLLLNKKYILRAILILTRVNLDSLKKLKHKFLAVLQKILMNTKKALKRCFQKTVFTKIWLLKNFTKPD